MQNVNHTLPEGWLQWETWCGRTYYQDDINKTTKWDIPQAPSQAKATDVSEAVLPKAVGVMMPVLETAGVSMPAPSGLEAVSEVKEADPEPDPLPIAEADPLPIAEAVPEPDPLPIAKGKKEKKAAPKIAPKKKPKSAPAKPEPHERCDANNPFY